MELSIIIVNYNVKYFLEQCLHSVYSAIGSINAEVWVVDNDSTDDSYQYIHQKYPQVQFIINSTNQGFSKANNQALAKANGEFILFLNPDTIIAEDTLSATINFLRSTKNAGALGIRMIDGTGHYLKESKRGFPTPWVSFCKMSGLTSLFPSSAFFSKYYLGNLPPNQNHPVEALSGAFMLVKKDILDKTGGFDERFFMYAEDIDLSFRIYKAGYQNYYFSDSSIIHFKGESTTKDRRYIKLFYKAMSQFVQKHYSGLSTKLLSAVLQAGIGIRAIAAGLFASKEPDSSITSPELFSLIGDEQCTKQLSKRIETKPDTENRIYCTGKQFTYKLAIQKIETCNNGANLYIHGSGTDSIVGSTSNKSRGIVIALRPLDSNNQPG